MLIWPKNFFFTKFEYGYQNNSKFYADLESVEKNATTKSYRQKKCAKVEFVLFYTTNLYKFLANNFFYVHFFQIFSTDLKSAENSAFFDTMLKKK